MALLPADQNRPGLKSHAMGHGFVWGIFLYGGFVVLLFDLSLLKAVVGFLAEVCGSDSAPAVETQYDSNIVLIVYSVCGKPQS